MFPVSLFLLLLINNQSINNSELFLRWNFKHLDLSSIIRCNVLYYSLLLHGSYTWL